MNERWMWLARYVELFKGTRFGKTGLNASRVAQFLGYGGALLVFWLLAQRAAARLPDRMSDAGWSRASCSHSPPFIVAACAHAVVLLILAPLMSKTWLPAYNWTFIALIILSAVWLVVALFTGSSSLAPLLGAPGKASHRGEADHRV